MSLLPATAMASHRFRHLAAMTSNSADGEIAITFFFVPMHTEEQLLTFTSTSDAQHFTPPIAPSVRRRT